MYVECYDESGSEVYDMILRHILQEVQIGRAINDVQIYVDPREPVFIIVVKYEKAAHQWFWKTSQNINMIQKLMKVS